jgi:DNA-binding NarL/FixJ family response regulator
MQEGRDRSTSEEASTTGARRGKKDAIQLLIVDDHAKYRAELRRLLQDEPDITICGEAHDQAEAMRLARLKKPDIILMDLELGEISSIHTVKAICIEQPLSRVILMVLHNDADLVLEGLRAGAWAHISKFSPPAEFAKAVRGVYAGAACVDSVIMGQILDEIQTY